MKTRAESGDLRGQKGRGAGEEPPMAGLGERDLREVLRVSRMVLECRTTDELRKEALHHLQDFFDCEKSTFFLAGPSGRGLDYDAVVFRGFDGSFLEQYAEYFHRFDPYNRALDWGQGVVTTRQIVSFRELMRSEYYNEFLRPQSIHYQMAIVLRSRKTFLGAMAFLRPRDAFDFSEEDKAKAELIVPFISETLVRMIDLERSTPWRVMMEAAPDLFPKNILLLDRDMQIVHVSDSARALIDRSDRGEGAGVLESVRNRCTCIQREMPYSPPRGIGEERFEVSAPSGHTVSILIRPVPEPGTRACFVIFLQTGDAAAAIPHRLRALGLSPRECEVSFLVGRGLTNADIAQKLSISRYTVENHLKAVYEKLGLRNRTSLAHLLASLD